MNWFTRLLSSTLGRKLLMALTGLFLILFLVVHLIGNLQLLKSDEGQAFNVYAKFMTSNPVIMVISYVNYTFILIHIVWAILLTRRNKAARGSESYAVTKNSSPWTSRNMGILGTLIFILTLSSDASVVGLPGNVQNCVVFAVVATLPPWHVMVSFPSVIE